MSAAERGAAFLERLPVGHHRVACPQCALAKHRRKDAALSVDVDARGGVYLCHRCGFTGGWRTDGAAYTAHRLMPSTSKPMQRPTLAANWRELWRSLAPISGTAAKYLQARGCALPPVDGDLRCSESLRHPSGYTGPALVALVTDALTGEPMTLHRTWINADGTKANVHPPRMLLGQHRKQGGGIRLFPDEAVTTCLVIAEGIETALTVAQVFRPVWSMIDAGNLGEFPVLDGIEELLICADHDQAGLRAADQCAERWHRAGRKVRIAKPPIPGEDLNDLARRAA